MIAWPFGFVAPCRRQPMESRSMLKRMLLVVLAGVTGGALLVAGFAAFCMRMPGASWQGELDPLDPEQLALRDRLRGHVEVLAGDIGTRSARKMSALNAAADYIEGQFREMGYVPATETFGEQGWRNLYVDVYGAARRGEVLVVGAHYDSVAWTPGADDNASGVAGLLEIARALRDRPLARSVRFIAFANEERPFFGGDSMGSRVAAKRSYDRGEQIVGMLSLEMIGFYSDEWRSQRYPRIVRRFYPRRGNFIGFVANLRSRALLHEVIGTFRARARFPSEGLAAPEWLVPDVRRSDNDSYWFYGFPAVMVTDTSNFRNFNYHYAGDLPGTLDYDRMARVVSGLVETIATLANP
jgi:hypothetical protein